MLGWLVAAVRGVVTDRRPGGTIAIAGPHPRPAGACHEEDDTDDDARRFPDDPTVLDKILHVAAPLKSACGLVAAPLSHVFVMSCAASISPRRLNRWCFSIRFRGNSA